MPSRLDHSPSCMWPPAASDSSSQCCASVTPRPDAYSSARRMSRLSCTPLPSSVNMRTPSAAISAIGASCSPSRPTVIAPATCTSHSAALRPRSSTSRTTRGAVDGRLGVRHGDDGGEAAERGGPRAGLDGLGFLAPGLAQVRVQVDQPGRDDAAAGVEHRAPSAPRSGPTAAMRPSSPMRRRRRARRVASIDAAALGSTVTPALDRRRSDSRCRAGGRARPCARRRRCAPGRR